MAQAVDNRFDAVVVDSQERIVALVEVKSTPVEAWGATLPGQLEALAQPVEFILAIDPHDIALFRPQGTDVGEPVVRLDTRKTLQHYDPGLSQKRVFEHYLVTLVEAWLRDLAYHWKSETPPGSEELRPTGVLEKLAGCTTRRLGV